MKFEVVEGVGEWIVRRDGGEVARFRDQLDALSYVTESLRTRTDEESSYSLAMRFQQRA